jgi:hypothetical protein
MIIHKKWGSVRSEPPYIITEKKEGWFLFGFIPLYIRTITWDRK